MADRSLHDVVWWTPSMQYDLLLNGMYHDRRSWLEARLTEDARVAIENGWAARASRRTALAVLTGWGLSRLGEALAATGGCIRSFFHDSVFAASRR